MKKTFCLISVLILVFLTCSCNSETGGNTENTVPGTAITDGVYIRSISGYSGQFTEDGSDRAVENIVMVTVENTGDKDIQLMYFSAFDSLGRNLSFEITTLPAGMKLTCCEKNGQSYSDGLSFGSVSLSQIAYFQQELSLYPETLVLMCADNTIEVRNISDSDYPGGRIHYKSIDGEILSGGITYSLEIPAIPKGESKVLSSRHFKDSSSRIVFIVNAE